jgi:two-component system CheB/CheR fusion protein
MSDANEPTGEETKDEAVADPTADRDFTRLIEKLRVDHNFDFREYKPASLARRIRSRMSVVRQDTFGGYLQYLTGHPDEYVALFNTILINITTFFRDPPAWAALRASVIAAIVEEARESRSIRMWSAGCASGEEPYSLAIVLADALGEHAPEYDVKIYATDVDEQALATARHGLYSTEQVKAVEPRLLQRHFTREGTMFRFRRDLRRWCIFGRHNLAKDPPLSHLDLIVCRNVLIYFSSDLQDKIIPMFHYALRESGFLFLGRAESLLVRSRRFTPVDLKWRIFRRNIGGGDQTVPLLVQSTEPVNLAGGGRSEAYMFGVRLQPVINALQSAVIVIDPADSIVTWNAAAETLFEIPADAAVGRKFRDLDISYRIEGLRARIEETKIRQSMSSIDDATFTRRSGEPVHASIMIVPLFGERQRIAGVLVSTVDATEQARLRGEMSHLAEQHATAMEELQSTNEELETTVDELQAANSQLAAMNAELERLRMMEMAQQIKLDDLADATVVIDRRLNVVAWGQSAERVWGLGTAEVIGRDLLTLPIGDAADRLRDPLHRIATGKPSERISGVSFSAGGTERRGTVRVARTRFNDTEDAISLLIWLEE